MNALRKVTQLPRWTRMVALAAVLAIVLGIGWYVFDNFGKTQITAQFPSTSGLYAGDDVRVLGVKVGRIDSVEPGKDHVTVKMTVDRGVDLPADAAAVIISPSLVTARFVQLAPAYTGGPKLSDGDSIPIERTAVPVEWDDIKTELSNLATALGPVGEDEQGSFGRFVDTAAENLDGNGEAFRATLHELSGAISTLSDGRTDLFSTIRNLQMFVDVLSKSNDQIVQFGGRLASVSSVLAGVSEELGAGLDSLDVAVQDVQRFIESRGGALTESVQRLSDVTQLLVDKRPELESLLHQGPTALVNFYQLYKPAQGSLTGFPVLTNMADPISFICGSIRGAATNDSDKSADLCAQMLGPTLQKLAMNYPPLMLNPATGAGAYPEQLVYSTPELAARAGAQVSVPKSLADMVVPGGR
ncbi:MCE family protein [Nocardia cyriacigeorgica]|uniref:MCE family protein n=1 Tax=Nocardia cyriacigeorgica TaxID=135487 RepID=A0A6P1D200_9NOCA|nr:MCE family protein [Nocardia cyriacigeorgica]NEW38780.1 MCE family protein [Nocardia cyriacigeorgica]NEW44437.1 MCE family protein [Nocardia cyriacigeorgica]NEW52813.1 MCE family protein [Nocardia cyriacigeorgica]NEW56831.1 MCE family protein [Nocardia cyriacigeorgica]